MNTSGKDETAPYLLILILSFEAKTSSVLYCSHQY